MAKKKKATKKVTKKKTAKKVTKKKTAAKKKVAKKVTKKKTAAKKKVAKKVTKKKTAAKKKAAKKVTKKKTAAKKKVAKKVTKKKTAAKKKTAKKVTKKKTAKKVAPKKAAAPKKEVKEKVVKEKKNTKKGKTQKPDFTKEEAKDIGDIQVKVQEEIELLGEDFDWDEIKDAISTMDFFVDPSSDECRVKDCENIATTLGYCRLHYISSWHEIQKKREILKEGRLQEYIEDLVSKYPAKYIESIIHDLSDDKDFNKVLQELKIVGDEDFDEDFDVDDDDDISTETRNFTKTSISDDE